MLYGNSRFYGIRAAAANIGQAQGNYTVEQFQTDFPQFFTAGTEETPAACLVPAAMLAEIINMANACIQPDKWLESWRYAVYCPFQL